MIIGLYGDIKRVYLNKIIIKVNNIFYEVFCSKRVKSIIDDYGRDKKTIIIYHYIKEDKQVLYGFGSYEERDMFISLLKIDKIGPSIAHKILVMFDVTELKDIILELGYNTLSLVNGVSRVKAEAIIDKLFKENKCN